jgi:pimeloyl-ACP methyl ester carboxylesterase
MPKLGLTMEHGTVLEWRRREGERIGAGEVILVIESEKVEFEVEAPAEGVVRSIAVPEGETVPCGAVLAVLTETAEELFDLARFLAEAHGQVPERAARAEGASGGRAVRAAPGTEREARPAAAHRASPRARKLAEREGLTLAGVDGTGPGGRITEEDVRRAIESLGPRVALGSARLAYADSPGPEPPVALLAGFGFDRTAFHRTVADLSGFRRLLALDLRGTGASSDPSEEALSVERLAEDVFALLDSLSVKRADLVGASLGAAVAVEAARRAPDRVRRLVLLSPAARPDARLAAALDSFCRAAEAGGGDLRLRTMAPWLFGRAFLSDRANIERVLGAAAGAAARIPARALRRHAEALARWLEGAAEVYAAVRAPALIVVGADDLLTPPSHAEEAAAALTGARLERLEGVGHAPMVEAPERLQALIRRFLESATDV